MAVGGAGGTVADLADVWYADATAFPGGEEIPNDDIDQDCDGADLTISDTHAELGRVCSKWGHGEPVIAG